MTNIDPVTILIEISEDNLVQLSVLGLANGETVLSGAQPGRQLFGRFTTHATPPTKPEVAYLDFEGIQVATASFLRESVIAFRDHARSIMPHLYPVIANASPSISEELEFFLKHRRDAFWVCKLLPGVKPREAAVLGALDEVHNETLDLVVHMGEATAPQLASQDSAGLTPTAWNNRLSTLASRGLLIERRAGKMKFFSPVLQVRDGD